MKTKTEWEAEYLVEKLAGRLPRYVKVRPTGFWYQMGDSPFTTYVVNGKTVLKSFVEERDENQDEYILRVSQSSNNPSK